MSYYVIDANVMLLAGTKLSEIPREQLQCWKKCIDFLHSICKWEDVIVVDSGWEILKEYRNAKSIHGYPNNSDNFYRYVLRNQQRNLFFVKLVKTGEYSFASYPEAEKLRVFDPPDRKYIAVAYNCEKHPPIVEAADSKWWGIREELRLEGIQVIFVDEDYIRKTYHKKMS